MSSRFLLVGVVLFAVLGGAKASHGALITFDFQDGSVSGAGGVLDGNASGSPSAANSGITLTLAATAQVSGGGNTGVFNLTGTGFGINADDATGGTNDDTDALDNVEGLESILFSATSNVVLSQLNVVSMQFDRFTLGDQGRLEFLGGGTYDFDDLDLGVSNSLAVNELIATGQEFTLSFVAGNGFGLESITFDATASAAVPEPSCLAMLVLGVAGLAGRRRRKKNAGPSVR